MRKPNLSSVLFALGVWLTLLFLFVSEINKNFQGGAGSVMDSMNKTKELIDGHR